MSAGIVFVQKYWEEIIRAIEQKRVDPTFIITHHVSMDKAVEMYNTFDQKKDGVVKVILEP
jgi:threonine dehydrogenase-like Zn-dependent dehydrogenase